MLIRKIKKQDNPFIKQIIQKTLVEFGLPKTGTAYEDNDTQNMFEAYQKNNAVYFVLEDNGKIIGGGGIKALNNSQNNICELQKMYFLPEARGKGYGKKLFNKCLFTAKEFGFKQCYLESDVKLKVAILIYKKNGFTHLNKPLGSTGHNSCGVWMVKNLHE